MTRNPKLIRGITRGIMRAAIRRMKQLMDRNFNNPKLHILSTVPFAPITTELEAMNNLFFRLHNRLDEHMSDIL